MPRRNEDVYGTHKFLNQPKFSNALSVALSHTNRELGTSATLRQVKCAISRGIVVRSNSYCTTADEVKTSVKAGLDSMLRPASLAAAFEWREVTVPWHSDSSQWWCRLSDKLYAQCDPQRGHTPY